MGKRSRKLWLISGFLYPRQVCDEPAVGKRVSKSATTGGRAGNRHRSRRSGASRLWVPGPPFHGPRPAGPPRHRPPPMKRIFVRYGCQGKPLPAALCTGRGAAVGRLPCRSTWPRHGTSGSSTSRQARDSGSPLADPRARRRQAVAPYHPMTQGKIERWHQTHKNRILLENYFLPRDLEAQIAAFTDDYNCRRYHESIDNLTPADVYFGRGPNILAERERIKRQTIDNRRLQHRLRHSLWVASAR